MNSWANVGDLVFVVGKDNEIVPCKIVKEIGTGNRAQLFFEVIDDKSKNKVPRNRLKCFVNQVGYNGGYVFKLRQNAVDYLEAMQAGNFNMSTIIGKKAQRVQLQQFGKSNKINVEDIKEQAANEAIDKVQSILISAMLLAMNSKLGIGPKRGAEVINEMNRLVDEVHAGKITQQELRALAEEKMKFKSK